MGKYLACGIATRIYVEKDKYSSIYMESNIEKIKRDLNKKVNLDNYNCIETEKGLVFEINPQFVTDNINELIREIHPVINCKEYFFEQLFRFQEINIEDFDKERYPLKLTVDNNHYSLINSKNNSYISEFYAYENSECWMLENEFLIQNLQINISYIPIWMEFNKYAGEDETNMLYFLNYFSRDKFKNPLFKDILFFLND